MMAVSSVTTSGRCISILCASSTSITWLGDAGVARRRHHLGDVVVGEAELGELGVTTDQVGHRVLELGDDGLERRPVGRGLLVQHDLGVDTQFLGNAHGIGRRVSIGVVEDGHGHGLNILRHRRSGETPPGPRRRATVPAH